jgi:hypothetical protein
VAEDLKSKDEQLRLVMDALAESVLGMADSEVEAEFRADPVPRTKDIFRAAAKRHAQAKLRAAQAQYEQASKSVKQREFVMPATAADRRALLDAFLSSYQAPGMTRLTAQFRDLKSVSDADVESTLRQLDALGALSEFRKNHAL